MLLAALFPTWLGLQPGAVALLVFALGLLALLAVGGLVWWLFERHTERVRQWASQAWAGFWNSIKV